MMAACLYGRPMRTLRLLASLALLMTPVAATACSPAPGYRVPTNMELASAADLILLATVTGGTPMESLSNPDAMRLDIRPIAALKGDLATAPTSLPLALATGQAGLLSNPYDLDSAHPIAYTGGCIRYMAPKGSRLLFFLKRDRGRWAPAGGPFSRWAEDVLTDDAPWLAATRFYLAIEAMPEAKRKDALAARRDELLAKTDDPVAQLLAADIDRQLAGPNKPLGEALPPPPAG